MKQLITRTLASLVLMVMSVSAISHAQSTTWVVKASIPFEFTVAGKVFPAGEYSLVEPIQHYLVLRDSRGHSVASVFTSGIDSSSLPATSKLRFDSSNGTPALVTSSWSAPMGITVWPQPTGCASLLSRG